MTWVKPFCDQWPTLYKAISQKTIYYRPIVDIFSDYSSTTGKTIEQSLDDNKLDQFDAFILSWPINDCDRRQYKGESETLVSVYLKKLLFKLRKNKQKHHIKIIKKWKKMLERHFPKTTSDDIIAHIANELGRPFCWQEFISSPFHQKFSRTLHWFFKLSVDLQQLISTQVAQQSAQPEELLHDVSFILRLRDNIPPNINHLQLIFDRSDQYEINKIMCIFVLILSRIFFEARGKYVTVFCFNKNFLYKKKMMCF